jgi:hypothetical protein
LKSSLNAVSDSLNFRFQKIDFITHAAGSIHDESDVQNRRQVGFHIGQSKLPFGDCRRSVLHNGSDVGLFGRRNDFDRKLGFLACAIVLREKQNLPVGCRRRRQKRCIRSFDQNERIRYGQTFARDDFDGNAIRTLDLGNRWVTADVSRHVLLIEVKVEVIVPIAGR